LSPGIDADFIRALGKRWDARSPVSVGILLDAFGKDPSSFEEMKLLQAKHRDAIKEMFDSARTLRATDREKKRILDDVEYSEAALLRTEVIHRKLARASVRTHEHFNASDTFDFHHAVVPCSYCDIVVLDKKWARRCQEAELPQGSARIFNGTQIDQIKSCLTES
jgi:hypothetical protein